VNVSAHLNVLCIIIIIIIIIVVVVVVVVVVIVIIIGFSYYITLLEGGVENEMIVMNLWCLFLKEYCIQV
jgi:hypothetical protein